MIRRMRFFREFVVANASVIDTQTLFLTHLLPFVKVLRPLGPKGRLPKQESGYLSSLDKGAA